MPRKALLEVFVTPPNRHFFLPLLLILHSSPSLQKKTKNLNPQLNDSFFLGGLRRKNLLRGNFKQHKNKSNVKFVC